MVAPFSSHCENGALLSCDTIETLQLNITRRCNLACKHCHVECSPGRTEDMSRATAQQCVQLFKQEGFSTCDITGGAPEMSSQFRYLVEQLSPVAQTLIVRTNLVIHTLPHYASYLSFFKEHEVQVVASLPACDALRAERQRGQGSYDASLRVLQALCAIGYGSNPRLQLHVVHNPNGAVLPGNQQELEHEYRQFLAQYNIVFNNLYALANNPSGRFLAWLKRSGNYERYMTRLEMAYNACALPQVMCRSMLSVNYDGRLFDCDFNLAYNLGVCDGAQTVDEALEQGIHKRRISIGDHCYGCTAGAGSS